MNIRKYIRKNISLRFFFLRGLRVERDEIEDHLIKHFQVHLAFTHDSGTDIRLIAGIMERLLTNPDLT